MPEEVLNTALDEAPKPSAALRVFTDTEDHALVQRRLGLFYGVLGAVVLGTWVAALVLFGVTMPDRFWQVQTAPPRLAHLVTGVGLAVVAAILRGKLRPRWLVSTGDLIGSAKLMGVVSAFLVRAPPTLHAEFLVLAPLILVVSLRAALVPSPPRWTALVAALAAAPAPFAAYAVALREATWDAAYAPRSSVFVICSVWSGIAVLAAFVISKVVYGLRSEVKKAMRLGQYTLEEKIGEGGMGIVHRARHALLRRPTAIKLLPAERTGASNVRRFEREVQLTSMLTHPNTIAVYDFGHTRSGVFYYAMELLDGVSLQELVERDGPQEPGRVIHVLAQVASALAEAHDVGLIHRDIKPANIFLCERGGLPDFVKVLDFGLVKEAGKSDPLLSRTGTIAGTPHYMAPESITEPASVDARVDLYALGAVGFFLLTGRPPFEGANLVEICSHHLHTAPDRPSRVRRAPVPPELEDLVVSCLAKSPEERPRDARALHDKLVACQAASPWNVEEARAWWRKRRASHEAHSVDPTGANLAAQSDG